MDQVRAPDPAATLAPESLGFAPPTPSNARASTPRARASLPRAAQSPPPAPRPVERPDLPDRYAERGLLGTGGMGEVWRVYDRVLDRTVALKLLRAKPGQTLADRNQFADEARATARLVHPGIIPIYDFGFTDTGRPWFTMQEIRGQTLAEVIGQIHAQTPRAEERAEPPPGFRRLVDVLERAARAVAYAHERGVVHRDLKPPNIMVGEHGEVMVVDWGLVRTAGIVQGIAGTPYYMAPEQARSERVDARTDVYGLGMIFWELCAGKHPFYGQNAMTVLAAVARDEGPGPLSSPWLIPEELLTLIQQSTLVAREARPVHAGAFADALRSFLDGQTRRDKARARIQAAQSIEAAISGMVETERVLRAQARDLLGKSQPWEPDTTREDAWAIEDEANALARQIAVAHREVEDELEAALIHDPDAIEAHVLLARRLRRGQEEAEQRGQHDTAANLEVRLRRHLRALPTEHAERRRAEAWLQGDGSLTLLTDPPGARVELSQYVPERRRLEPQHVRTLGHTPLHDLPLPQGSWLITLHAPGRAVVNYPVHIGRLTRWDGVPPHASSPFPIHLPPTTALDPDDCYVPAGWVTLGGDPGAPAGLPARHVWVDGFVMRRFPVTNREYLGFLNDLVVKGDLTAAERYAPRNRGSTPNTWGDILYGRTAEGGFVLQTDTDGDTWLEDWPVIMVDHVAAWSFARWEAARTGLGWRLPGELEWEKAARGVDQRIYPWGNFTDPTWCNNRRAHAGSPRMEAVGLRPTDVSPYGVRDMAGGVVEWTADRMSVDGPVPSGSRVPRRDGTTEDEAAWLGRTATWRIVGKGGSRGHDLNAVRCAFRLSMDPWSRASNVGFRLVRSIGS